MIELLPQELVLVRHGHSEQNLINALRRDGHDIGDLLRSRPPSKWRLTEKGVKQAEEIGQWLAAHFSNGFDRYLVSTYSRAQETAGLMDLPGAAWLKTPLLCERMEEPFGKSIGEQEDTYKRRLADLQNWRKKDQFHWSPDAGESMVQVVDRALGFLLQTQSLNASRVLAVTHGGFMRVLRLLLAFSDAEQFVKLEQTRVPQAQVWNCEVWHFTKYPDNGIRTGQYWLRRMRPLVDDLGEWEPIILVPQSNSSLLNSARELETLDLPEHLLTHVNDILKREN